MEQEASVQKPFTLNKKRTFLIGFAFFGILLLWQVYDLSCSKFLEKLFMDALGTNNSEDVQYLVGVMMAIDNIAALILLPIFGHLSDKTNTRIGKRMPYILIGTFITAIAFPFIPVFFHLNNLVGVIIMMAVVVLFSMMYRNPAVALMPDMTPKPLRSKANGIINIMGYIGGFVGTLFTMFFVISKYLGEAENPGWQQGNVWAIELPFLLGSIFMVISALVLFIFIKENKIRDEVYDEMKRGEEYSEATDKKAASDDDSRISKSNLITLLLILTAEFFWFMADNGIGTFVTNYVSSHLGQETSLGSVLTIVGGVGSVIGFVVGGLIASKITRKWTLISGLVITIIGYVLWIVMTFSNIGVGGEGAPFWLYIVWAFKGFGMSLVHVNSYPMVVELCSTKKIGRFTGYYYASSMTAQSVTPILLGLLLLHPGIHWDVLPIYAGACVLISIIIFLFVKNVKNTKTKFKKGLEALDVDE